MSGNLLYCVVPLEGNKQELVFIFLGALSYSTGLMHDLYGESENLIE